jgi:hypothetical protein
MENMSIYNKFRKPPKSALKEIRAGRLKGKTDINPQWRYEAMTEMFGPHGIGWWYTVDKKWNEVHEGEVLAFVDITLYYVYDGIESKGCPGSGGSHLVTNERNGIHVSDEGYKMAETDALSTAMKKIGIAGDIYAGLWDGSKYKDETPAPQPQNNQPASKNKSKFSDIQELRVKIEQGVKLNKLSDDAKKELFDQHLNKPLDTCTDIEAMTGLLNFLRQIYKEANNA